MTQGNKCLGTILFLSVKCQDFILKILLTRHFGPTPNFSEKTETWLRWRPEKAPAMDLQLLIQDRWKKCLRMPSIQEKSIYVTVN